MAMIPEDEIVLELAQAARADYGVPVVGENDLKREERSCEHVVGYRVNVRAYLVLIRTQQSKWTLRQLG